MNAKQPVAVERGFCQTSGMFRHRAIGSYDFSRAKPTSGQRVKQCGLMEAAGEGQEAVVRLLLENGADARLGFRLGGNDRGSPSRPRD
jgi:hypothetical protein